MKLKDAHSLEEKLWPTLWSCSVSRVRLFVTPRTVSYHAPPSMGFSRQEYWSGVPFPSPEDLPNPGKMTNLDSTLKSRDITLPTKVHLVMAMVFPIVMYGCESWTVIKAEGRRIDAFELWCWKRLESLSECKEIQPVHPKGDQSWNIHWKDWCWSWNANTLATWCKELTHLKRPWCWERLKVGGEGDDRGWDGWMASPTQWTWIWVNLGSWWWTGRPGMLQSMVLQSWTRLSDWTELNRYTHIHIFFFMFFSIMVYHRILNIVAYAIE